MKKLLTAALCAFSLNLFADKYLIDGVVVEGEVHEEGGMKTICNDEMCMLVPEDAIRLDEAVSAAPSQEVMPQFALPEMVEEDTKTENNVLAQGYMNAEKFLEFLNGATVCGGEAESSSAAEEDSLENKGVWLVLLIALIGGLLMNLTPCVLPMIPINLMIIGKSAARGAWYGLGIMIAYGVMGVLAALGGMAFGEIQANPYFNIAIAALFVLLALALSGAFMIDLSKNRAGLAKKRQTMMPWLFAFFMGLVSAVLAGACVAPILISVLLLTAKLYAAGNTFALVLPFVLGLGMALPWPLLGAGMQVLPKPGTWMKYVNKLFAAFVFLMAAYYGYLAYKGFAKSADDSSLTPDKLAAAIEEAKGPVLIDCWASWCKNCTAMEEVTFKDEQVAKALERFTVIRVQAEDIRELKAIPGFEGVMGLPAFMIIEK